MHPRPRAELPGASPVAEALGRIEHRLIDAGLLLAAEQRRRIRHTGWMLWAVVAVGAIPVIADGKADKSIGFLLVVVTVGAAVVSLTAPRRTDRGNAELTPRRPPHGSLRDGWDFARDLAATGRLAPLGQEELAAREVTWHYDGRTTPKRRRLPALRRVPGGVVVQLAGQVRLFRGSGPAPPWI